MEYDLKLRVLVEIREAFFESYYFLAENLHFHHLSACLSGSPQGKSDAANAARKGETSCLHSLVIPLFHP